MTRHPAYAAMLRAVVASRGSMLRRFRTDLVRHDKGALSKMPADAKVWWYLYDSGTHMCRERPSAGLLETLRVDFPGGQWHHWDGSRMRRGL